MSYSMVALLGVCGLVIGSVLAFYAARSRDRVRHDYRSSVDYRARSINDPEYRGVVRSLTWKYRGACALAVVGAGVLVAVVVKVQLG